MADGDGVGQMVTLVAMALRWWKLEEQFWSMTVVRPLWPPERKPTLLPAALTVASSKGASRS